MRGEFLPIWSETWRGIWSKLAKHPDAPEDLFSELYPELAACFAIRLTPEKLAEAVGSPAKARASFRSVKEKDFPNEKVIVELLERAFTVAADLGSDPLSNHFFVLVEDFTKKFSLRYDLRRPFSLNPTPSGVYSKLYSELAKRCNQDTALSALLRDYREAFQDLKLGTTSGRINTCLQKQVNLLEGLTSLSAGVTSHTLGQMCGELQTWPSTAVSEAAKSLYGFASDHTGLRHGTIKKAKAGKMPIVHRDMEIRDLVAVSVFFTGLTAYLSDQIDSQIVYGG